MLTTRRSDHASPLTTRRRTRTGGCRRGILALLLLGSFAAAQDGLDEWLDELRRKTDDVDVALIAKVAETKTRTAAIGLVRAYEDMKSIFMRREIVRALAAFDGVRDAQQPAFEAVANVATGAEEPELREAAIRVLGQSPGLGKEFLRRIVDAPGNDSVREQALAAHVKLAEPADAAWYRHLWNLKSEQRKHPDGSVQGPELNSIRELAFAGVVGQLTEDDLVETLRRELDPKIRSAALQAMHKRNLPKTDELAQWMVERVDFTSVDRGEAARILITRQGAKAVSVFLDLAKKRDVTPEDLRQEMAKLISALDDDATNKRIVKLIGRGKVHEQVFALQAAWRAADPKLIRKELQDREFEVRRAAAEVLARRLDVDSLPDLRNLIAKPKTPDDARIAIDAISVIQQGSPRWQAELAELSKRPDASTRNAALDQLAQTGDPTFVPVYEQALASDDWSTRLIAIDGLVGTRDKRAVPVLIERLDKERGRMSRAIADALWKLSGMPFEENVANWRGWWAAEGEKFTVLSAADFDKAAKDRELRRLQARTRSGARFFGIRLETQHVIFVIDSSGSMLEPVYGREVDNRPAARIDVAKEELAQCIKNLDANAMFNVFAFSMGVGRWLKQGLSGNTEQSRQAALTWIDRLGAAGGTNLYDSLKIAFADPDVDTLFVLSDGEPTAGEVIDPGRIRDDVAFWNRHRHIKIHTIAIGGNLQVLEWIAADSGGSHVRIR